MAEGLTGCSPVIFSFTELTAAIPHAGGPFAYSFRAFGPFGGFVAGRRLRRADRIRVCTAANIVTMSVFGAILLYIVSMLSLFKLRKSEPHLARPFATPFYPWFPAAALVLAVFCLLTMMYYSRVVFALFVALFAISLGFCVATKKLRLSNDDALLKPVP